VTAYANLSFIICTHKKHDKLANLSCSFAIPTLSQGPTANTISWPGSHCDAIRWPKLSWRGPLKAASIGFGGYLPGNVHRRIFPGSSLHRTVELARDFGKFVTKLPQTPFPGTTISQSVADDVPLRLVGTNPALVLIAGDCGLLRETRIRVGEPICRACLRLRRMSPKTG
jgi:hypothetical protein